jgi:K+-transporting ATPase ATPase A chain
MNERDFLQLAIYLVALVALTPVLGKYMARVFQGERTLLSPVLGPIERSIYKLGGVDASREMTWLGYTGALLAFNLLGFLVTLAQLMTQAWLPLNPAHLPNVPFPLALNTAVSFMTNTNWQAYSGESTMSYLSQMTGLAVHNFTSAATGFAALLALVRGLTRKQANSIGNFWTDLTRSTLYVLLPLSFVFALVLVSQGVVQNFRSYDTATLITPYETEVAKTDAGGQPVKDAQGNVVMEKTTVTEQIIPQGPAASQIAIKQLGTNGGGYFGVNSAHPFENPTPLSNFLEMLAILLLPSALVYTFGVMVGDKRQGWSIWAAMFALAVLGFIVAWIAEVQPNPVTGLAGSMEGKEQRFGVMNSVLWASTTTDASNGSVNAMHDSLSPLAGLVTIVNIMLGEVVFGGIGAGLYGMLMFVILTVFIAGLMVGRTPEYLGKKIEAAEIKWAVVAVLAPCVLILTGTAIGVSGDWGLATLNNQGPHGLSEVLYAFASAAGNNGSAFAGLGVNTNFYNFTLAAIMFLGRFAIIVPVLAIAGSMARKKVSPPSAGTFPTTGATFTLLLICVILIVGALTFLPVLSLGPIVEHFLMLHGRAF